MVTCDGSHRHRARRGQGTGAHKDTTDPLSYSFLEGKAEYLRCFVALFRAEENRGRVRRPKKSHSAYAFQYLTLTGSLR
jgi:hypothetical protein